MVPPPFCQRGALGGESWIDSSWSPHCCLGTGRAGFSAPPHPGPDRLGRATPALSETEVSRHSGFVPRRRSRRGWGRLGGWTPARGASGAGLRGRGGALESPPSGSLFSRETFFPHPPALCKALAPGIRCSRSPRCAPLGRSPWPHDFSWGGPFGHCSPNLLVKLPRGRGWPA